MPAKSLECKSTRKTTQSDAGEDRVPSVVVDGLIGGGFDGCNGFGGFDMGSR